MNGTQRRTILQWMASASLLPLSSAYTAAATKTETPGMDPKRVSRVSFSSMAAPSLSHPAAMATTTVGSVMTVKYADNTYREFDLAYEPFFLTGDLVSDGKGGQILAGGYVDIQGKPILDKSGATSRPFFSDAPDGMSLLKLDAPSKVAGITGNAVYAVVQFEYTTRNLAGTGMYGMLPSPIAVLTLNQDKQTGKLKLVKYHNVDTSSVKGLWITCGASLSPWGTHLSSEEYEPDAFDQGVGNPLSMLQGFSTNLFGNAATAKAYDYGHLPEVTVSADGTGTIQKHYCLGRTSKELVQVMPDNRTVLMGDDYTNGVLFLFIADKAKDLSSGTLYAAKYTSALTATSSATISWIKLGSASSAEIKAMVDGGIQPTDVMDSLTADPGDPSYTKIVLNKKNLWVRAKAGKEKAAAFLETHRYAALKGASASFTKMEGTTVNIKDRRAYSAISAIKDSMVVGKAGHVPELNVNFTSAVNAGGILEHTLDAGQKDSEGKLIPSEWVPSASRVLLLGQDLPVADSLGNLSNPDKISMPDNLKFSESMRTLFIGEDSGLHVNNFLWAYHIDTQELSRVLSCPSGAESTGLHAVDAINGWTYIMSNFQHAGDWEAPLHDVVKPTLDPLVKANYQDRFGAHVGYLTATPKQTRLTK